MPNDTAPNPKIQPISRVPSSTPQVKHGGQLARSSRQAGTTVASTQSATTASKASGQPKQIQVKLKPVKGSGTGGEMDEADITITLASRQDTPLLESPSPDHIWKKPDQETGKKERREQGMRWKSHTRDKRGSNGSPLRVTPKVDLPKTSTTVPQETVANSGHAQAPLPNVVNKLTKPSLSVVAAAAGNGGKANHLLQPHRPRVGGVGAVARHLAMSAVLGGRGIGHAVERAGERETTDNQRTHDRTGTTQNVKSSNPTTPSEGETAFAARPDHDGDTAVPPINRHSAPDVSKSKSNVPDLSSIKARTPPGQFDESIASAEAFITKPFSLQSPAYADTDIPLPEPYNAAYPHPLTAYASPGVNPATVRVSGYGKALAQLIRTDPEKVLGAILASSKHKDIVVPALALHTTIGDGNGIPERLWERFDSLGAAPLPVGVAGVSPFAQSAPRFLQALSHCPDRNPGAAADCRVSDTPYTLGQPRNLETYAQHRMRHALSANDLDGRASAFHPTIRWYSDETTPTESNFASSGEQGQQHIDSTPFFKTDICVSWEAHGMCRYGMQCQYAHGLHDLRNLSKQPFTFGSSPMDPDHGTPQDKQSAYGNQLTTSQAESRPVPIPTAPRLEPRRLSAPSSRLPTVAEHDHDIPLPFAHWHQSPISVPPIGAERSSPPRSQDLAKCLSSSFGRAETAPSLSRQSGFTSTENKVTPRGSSSSLSTSSSSRYSLITGASEGTSVCWSPIDTDMVAPVASKPSKSDVPPPLDFLGSASLDFSTGKSIWC